MPVTTRSPGSLRASGIAQNMSTLGEITVKAAETTSAFKP
jgi:hypothetical protein